MVRLQRIYIAKLSISGTPISKDHFCIEFEENFLIENLYSCNDSFLKLFIFTLEILLHLFETHICRSETSCIRQSKTQVYLESDVGNNVKNG